MVVSTKVETHQPAGGIHWLAAAPGQQYLLLHNPIVCLRVEIGMKGIAASFP